MKNKGISRFLIAYGAVLLAFLLLDGIWLGVIARETYITALQGLLRQDFPILPWVIFYLLYGIAIVHLVVAPNYAKRSGISVVISGAVLGMAAYGAYNMTNYAILADWPLAISIKDWLWGTVVTATSSWFSWKMVRRFC
ncbi:MAG: putative membrane protein [Paraglaciecola sp.]|jgi:uncharacterized membrane protein